MALVRHDEVRARCERVCDITPERIGRRPHRLVTSATAALDVVYEAARVVLGVRKVQRVASLGARESPMHVAMAYRSVTPLVAVLIGASEDGFVHGNSCDQQATTQLQHQSRN